MDDRRKRILGWWIVGVRGLAPTRDIEIDRSNHGCEHPRCGPVIGDGEARPALSKTT